VNDPDASKVLMERVRKKCSERLLGFWHREAVQVDFRLDPVLTTAELAQDDLLDSLAGEDQFFPAREFGITHVGVQAFLQHRMSIRAGKACARGRSARGFHHRSVVS
jgi:hypothetical protein